MDRCVGAQCARNGGDDPCPCCRCTHCHGFHPEGAKSFYFGKMDRSVHIECFGDEENGGDELCPYCMSTDFAGHDPEDAKSFYLKKFEGLVSIGRLGDEGDEPCPYCGHTDCAGHTPEREDAGSLVVGKIERWVGDELSRRAVKFKANELD